VVTVDPASATPTDVINEAERQALAMASTAPRDGEQGVETEPARLR
jgi:hypothetical protein